jgi:PAS domain-containing protein
VSKSARALAVAILKWQNIKEDNLNLDSSVLTRYGNQGCEKRFRMLVEQAGDGFFIHDYEGKIMDVNLTACEML